VFQRNVVHDNGGIGIHAVVTSRTRVLDNLVYGQDNGIYLQYVGSGTGMEGLVRGNRVHSVSGTGIDARNGMLQVLDNEVWASNTGIAIYDSTARGNKVWGTNTGIDANQSSLVEASVVYASNIGIDVGFSQAVGNRVYGNTIGIRDSNSGLVRNNLLWDNTTGARIVATRTAIDLQGFYNNTLFSNATDVLVDGSATTNARLVNNIFAGSSGGGGGRIEVAADSERGFASDYNLFAGSYSLLWDGDTTMDLQRWRWETGNDWHSRPVATPGFLDTDGADNRLGWVDDSSAFAPIVLDDGDAGVVLSGSWTTVANGFGGDHREAVGGNAQIDRATYTFSGLAAGTYQVAASWNITSGMSSLVPYQIYQGAAQPENMLRSMRTGHQTLPADFTAGGAAWRNLGTVEVSGNTLTVVVSDLGVTTGRINADAIRLQRIDGNVGADDDFRLRTDSAGVNAGDPAYPFHLEPLNNGTRIDQGAYGNTPLATVTAAPTLQITGPDAFAKLEVGTPANVTWHSAGLQPAEPVLLINVNGGPIDGGERGAWQRSVFQTTPGSPNSLTFTVDLSTPLAAPAGVYQTTAGINSGINGRLAWDVPLADGAYVVRLHFAEIVQGVNPGDRRFDIQIEGETRQANFDIRAEAGASWKAVVKEFQVNVTGGNLDLDLVSRTNAGALLSGIEIQRVLSGVSVAATVDLELSLDQGQSWQTLATGLAMDRFGNGRFAYTPTQETDGNTALFRAVAREAGGRMLASDRSDEPFLIGNGGSTFYINDSSRIGDQYSTAVGDNAYSGKRPDRPMASLAALLRAYDLEPGDVVSIDQGSYRTYTAAQLLAEDSGVTLRGPVGLGSLATLVRGNLSGGQYVFQFAGADDVTIERLSLTGVRDAVFFSDNADSDRNTLRNNEIHSVGGDGVYIGPGNDNNRIESNLLRNNERALYSLVNSGLVMVGNELRNNNNGANLQGLRDAQVRSNSIHDNRAIGLYVYFAQSTTVSDNEIYNHTGTAVQSQYGSIVYSGNLLHHNGIAFDGFIGATLRGNWIYANTTGVQGYDIDVDGNRVFSNSVGILDTNFSRVVNNVVYANTNQGIRVQGQHSVASGDGVFNNTVLQLVGEAIRVTGGATDVVLQNNIVRVDAGFGLSIDANSQTRLVSDSNLLFRGPASNAFIGLWSGATQSTLAAWRTASGRDANSVTGDPLLLDVDGADNILGEQGLSTGNGFDDNFDLDAFSAAIDSANAYVAPPRDIEDRPRNDDPDVSNRGRGLDLFVAQNQAGSQFAAIGTTQNVRQNEGSFEQTLPFSFGLYGKTYTRMSVNVNGFLHFEGPDSPHSVNAGSNSTETLLRNVRIAPLWDNLSTLPSGRNVFVASSASELTVRWAAVLEGTSSPVNFSVTLFPNGSFRVDYGDGNTGLTPTVGVSAGNSQTYVLSSYDGRADLGRAASQLWLPTPGLVYFDIGAYEFQGNSGDRTGPTVTTISVLPAEGGSTALAFSSVQVGFSEPLNGISARSPANYELRSAGADGAFNTGDDRLFTVNPFYSFPETNLVLDFGGVLPDGQFRLLLSGTRAIFDTSGNALDGNNDGTAGGDYVRQFTIDRSTNRPPVAQPQSPSLAEGGSLLVTLLGTDADNDVLAYSIVGSPLNGTLGAFDPLTRQVTYTPGPRFNGSDSFSFRVNDGKTGTSTATIALTVTPVNQTPVAVNQSLTLDEGASLPFKLSASDVETAAANLGYLLVSGPANGTLVQGSGGDWIYTPAAAFSGNDSFTWQARDRGDPDGSSGNTQLSNVATVSLRVANVNDAPVIRAVSAITVDEGSPVSLTLVADDPDGPNLRWALVGGPAGAVIDPITGAFSWTPADGDAGVSITVRVNDGASPPLADQKSFTVNVRNVVPLVQLQAPDGSIGQGGQPFALTVQTNDPGTDTIVRLEVDWGDGSVETINGNPTRITHTFPERDGNFTVTVRPVDEDGTHPGASINLSMVFNDPPVAGSRVVTLDEDNAVDIQLTGSDPEGQALVFAIVTPPTKGALSGFDANTGRVRYTPNANLSGIDSFNFRVTDPQGASGAGSINLIVDAVNDLPVVSPIGDVAVDEGTLVQVQAAGSDVEAGTNLVWSLFTAPAGASIEPATGLITWAAADGPAVADFTVRASDPQGGIGSTSFRVTVANVAPTLTLAGAAQTTAGQSYAITFGRSDPGQDTLTGWRIEWGDGNVSNLPGNASGASHVYTTGGSFAVLARATDEDGSYSAPALQVNVQRAATPLVVSLFELTDTGFALRFDRAVDATRIRMYGADNVASDVLLNGPGGRVHGTLVFDADGQGARFVRTGGLLALGDYTLTLASGPGGFVGLDGQQLDGNANGTAGDAFVRSFSVAAPTSAVLSVEEFARGPGQEADYAPAAAGFRVSLQGAAGASQLGFVLRYDARLLTVSAVQADTGLPVGATLITDIATPGEVRVQITLPAPLAGDAARSLLQVVGRVPNAAPYGAAQVLRLTDVQLEGGTRGVRSDDGVHAVAYLGDANADRSYSDDDVTLMGRVAARQDSGFEAYGLIDPVRVADISRDGIVNSTDRAVMNLRLQGGNPASLPPIPAPAQIAAAPARALAAGAAPGAGEGQPAVPSTPPGRGAQPSASVASSLFSAAPAGAPVVRVDGGALDFGLQGLAESRPGWVGAWLGEAPSKPANAWKLKL